MNRILTNLHSFILGFLFLITLMVSCGGAEEDLVLNAKGEIEYLEYNWKIPLNFDGFAGLRSNPNFSYNMSFDNVCLINTTNNDQSRNISCVDLGSGEINWNWSDWYQPTSEGVSLGKPMVRENEYRWVTGTRHYIISLENGETTLKWRDLNELSMNPRSIYSESIDKVLFLATTANIDGTKSTKLYSSEFNSFEYQNLLNIPYSTENIGEAGWVKSIGRVEVYRNNGKDYLIIESGQPGENWTYDKRLNLYNLSDGYWEYLDVIIAQPKQNNGGHAKIYNDSYYLTAGKEMFCYDINSGKLDWKKEFSHDFTFSGFEIADNILVANCENQICYGVDTKNGDIRWQSEGSGTSSKLESRIMNGVVYFDGGGPAYLFAKDIYSGKTIWRLDPSLYDGNNGSWQSTLNLIPAQNGKNAMIVALDRNFAYCFDAVR